MFLLLLGKKNLKFLSYVIDIKISQFKNYSVLITSQNSFLYVVY